MQITRPIRAAVALALAFASLPAGAAAQDRTPGVELGLLYSTRPYQPALAFRPFQGRMGGEALAGQVEAIVARDLRYSDRYRVMDSIPASFLGQETIDYTLWDRLGAAWLLSGSVEGSGDGYVLVLELHDIVYRQLKEQGRFRIPEPMNPDFRMAVHRAADEVVRWTFNEPGMAASRIAFPMLRGGVKELWLVDSDGENLQRLTNHSDVVLSPAWAPDGRRIAYSSPAGVGYWQIYEYDLTTRRSRQLPIGRDEDYITPAYHPNGEVIAFAVRGATRGGMPSYQIGSYNVARNCCLTRLTEPTRDDLSPTFSADGRFIAFNSNRFGDAVPQIFVMPASGGAADLISPYEFNRQGHYAAPDWSPFGNNVAFHGRVGRNGAYHILIARMGERGRLTQLTSEGQNEDPSWAPDGRHIVFVGERRWGKGLFVVDTVTGNIRTLLSGVDVSTPQWSPLLAAADASTRPR